MGSVTEEGMSEIKDHHIGGAIIAVIGLALGAAAAAGPLSSSGSSTLPSSSCGPVFYKGSGSPQYLIATDLPLQGAGRAQLLAMQQAVQFVLEKQYKFKAGKFTVGYQGCDDSTAQTGAWDPAKCSSNARAYAAEKTLIGVLGTFNSGCAKLDVPILNRAPGGAVAMLSSANTNVGLTHFAPWNSPGEPKIYYPTGVRNYARVAASDDYQGPAGVTLLQSKAFKLAQGKKFKAVKNVFIVHDNQTFGKGVAQAFQAQGQGSRPQSARLRAVGREGDELRGDRRADQVIGSAVRVPRRHRLQQRREAAQGPPRRCSARTSCSSGPTAGRRTRRPSAQARRPRACTSATRANRSKSFPQRGRSSSPSSGRTRRSRATCLRTPSTRPRRRRCMLDAIGRSDGTRASVVKELFKTNVKNGIMGTFRFDKNGDIVPFKWISFDQLRGKNGVPVYAVVEKVGK